MVAALEENSKVYTFSVDYAKLISRVAGFETVEEYFMESTVSHKLHKIEVPTLFLSAEDDPIFGAGIIPVDHQNDKILLAVTKTGGHICYFEGALVPHR